MYFRETGVMSSRCMAVHDLRMRSISALHVSLCASSICALFTEALRRHLYESPALPGFFFVFKTAVVSPTSPPE